jgi:hypothetical protein
MPLSDDEYKLKGDFMKQFIRTMLCLICLLLCLPQVVFAAESPVSTKHATDQAAVENAGDDNLRDPAAIAEFKRATDFLTSLPRFHVKASILYDVIQEDGRSLQYEKYGDVYLQRPDRFFAEVYFDDGRFRQIWYDGKMLSIAERSKNLYTRIKAPPSIDATLDMMEGLFKDPQPLSDLYYSDLTPLHRLAVEADMVGDSLVNGRPCTHLSFRGKKVDWQLWIEKGETPFFRKLIISYREEPGTPQTVAVLNLWETPDQFSEEMFNFIPLSDSQWIDILVPMPRKVEEGEKQ